MGNHWNIRFFLVYIQKHILVNLINFKIATIYLNISLLNNISVSCKETDIRDFLSDFYRLLIL